MNRTPVVCAARRLFEPLESRVFLAVDGVHAVAVEYVPSDGLRYGSAVALASDADFDEISFSGGLTFTFDQGENDNSIRGFKFLGAAGAFDIGMTFGPSGDRFETRTSVGSIDGRPSFTFASTPETGAWSLIVFAPFENREGLESEIAGSYATGIAMPTPNAEDVILGAGLATVGGGAFAGTYVSNDSGLASQGLVDLISAVDEQGRAMLGSGGMLMVGLDALTILGRGLDGVDGAVTAGFRRVLSEAPVTTGSLEGSTYGVAMFGAADFFDPMNQADLLPMDAARASIRFRDDGYVERFNVDPEFVKLNPQPQDVGVYSVGAGNILEIRWNGPGAEPVVSRFEVSSDGRALLPIDVRLSADLNYAFGIGVRTDHNADLPPIDPPDDPPGDPSPPGGGGDGGGDGGSEGMGEGEPMGPPVPRLEDMESASARFDPLTGRVTLLVEFRGDEPTYDVVELWRHVSPAFTSRPAVTVAGDGSAIYVVGVTDAGVVSVASNPDGTFEWEEIISNDDDASIRGAVLATHGGVVGLGAYADSNKWLIGLRRLDDNAPLLLRAMGDVDDDGLIEFEQIDLKAEAGPPPIFANTSATLLHTPWGTTAYIYPWQGDLYAVWTHKGLEGGQWRSSNLTENIDDLVHPGAAVSALAADWGTMHITYETQDGDLRQVWWDAGRGTWLEHQLGDTVGASIAAPTSAFFDRDARSLNFLAVDDNAGAAVLVTWDSTSRLWRPLRLAQAISDAGRGLFAHQFVRTSTGRADIVGVAGTDLRPEFVWTSGLTPTYTNGPAATLGLTYIVVDEALSADAGELASTDLARYQPLFLDL